MMRPLDKQQYSGHATPFDQNSIGDRESVLMEAQMRFQRAPYQELHSVQCDFHKGVLTLRGQVPSSFLKQIAQSLVFSLDRIELIDNRLEVSGS